MVTQRTRILSVSFGIVLADQMLKRYIEHFPIGDILYSAAPVFDIVHTSNPGAAFSIFAGKTLLLLVITTALLLLLFLAILGRFRLTNSARWGAAILLGGGIGNWLDRFFTGTVTDYIRPLFIRFPVFNLSDICITLSVFYILILLITDHFEITGETHGTDH